MPKLVWDKTGERRYETGVSQGALYPIQPGGAYSKGVAWNGLSAVTESPSGAEPSAVYADNIKYLNMMSAEEFGGTIEAYTAPDEFKKCIGEYEIIPGFSVGMQKRSHFGFVYKTIFGNDSESNDYGYKLHLIFDCQASSTEKGYQTVNDSPEAITSSWEFVANSVSIGEGKSASMITINSVDLHEDGLANVLNEIEKTLYGSDKSEPQFASALDIADIFQRNMFLIDTNEEALLDSNGEKIRSMVY